MVKEEARLQRINQPMAGRARQKHVTQHTPPVRIVWLQSKSQYASCILLHQILLFTQVRINGLFAHRTFGYSTSLDSLGCCFCMILEQFSKKPIPSTVRNRVPYYTHMRYIIPSQRGSVDRIKKQKVSELQQSSLYPDQLHARKLGDNQSYTRLENGQSEWKGHRS